MYEPQQSKATCLLVFPGLMVHFDFLFCEPMTTAPTTSQLSADLALLLSGQLDAAQEPVLAAQPSGQPWSDAHHTDTTAAAGVEQAVSLAQLARSVV